MSDWQKDSWIEQNAPKEEKFDRGFVKHLMKLAYEEGQKRQQRSKAIQDEEDRHGPQFM